MRQWRTAATLAEIPNFMKYSRVIRFAAIVALFLHGLMLLHCRVDAQGIATGAIEGRVTNSRTAQSLENARVVIVGSGRIAFTDDTGRYQFPNVPADAVKLEVFHTGYQMRTDTLTVSPGQTDTYLWVASTLTVDVAGEYRLGKRFAVFSSARNLTDEPAVLERYGPGTPASAKLRQYDKTGALLSFGVKGTF